MAPAHQSRPTPSGARAPGRTRSRELSLEKEAAQASPGSFLTFQHRRDAHVPYSVQLASDRPRTAIITGNTAASGGGIYNAPGGTVTLDKTLVVGNKGGDIVGTVKIE